MTTHTLSNIASGLGLHRENLGGIVLAVAIAIGAGLSSAWLDGTEFFSPGPSVLAVAAGIGTSLILGRSVPTGAFFTGTMLPVSIVLLGFGLNAGVIISREVGLVGILAVVASAVGSFGVALVVGRLMGLSSREGFALGAGGAVCGNTAVAAVAPALRLEGHQTALLLATVNLLGLLTFALVPIAAGLVGMTASEAGIWAGASVHAVPQAVAAGEAIGSDGLVVATAVKLSRVMLLVLVVPLAAMLGSRVTASDGSYGTARRRLRVAKIPWFVPGFVAAVLIGSFLVPNEASESVAGVGRTAMLPVLAAVGLSVRRESLMGVGGRFIVTGVAATFALMALSLGAILIFSD